MKIVPDLYDHQKECFTFIKDKDQFALFMEMGTGKSKVIIEKVFYLWQQSNIDCVIIISPNAVKSQWVDEQFEAHYPLEQWSGYTWNGAKTKRDRLLFANLTKNKEKLFVFSVNVEAFQSESIDLYINQLIQYRKIFVVIDESTRIKNGRRKTRGKRNGAKRTNKILDLFLQTKYKAILTGTPTPNNPFDLWSQFEFLQQDFFKMDYFFFTHHYGIMIQKATTEGRKYTTVLDEKSFAVVKSKLKQIEKLTPIDVEKLALYSGLKTKDIMQISNMDTYSGYKNLDKLKEKISKITFFVKKKDCLDLPDKVYEKLYCTMDKEQKDIYTSLKKTMTATYIDKEITVTQKLVMFLRLQMITGGLFPFEEIDMIHHKDKNFNYQVIENSCKIKILLEDLEEVSNQTSIIVWARFRGEIDLIYNELVKNNYTCEKYYGGSEFSIIKDFQNKDFQILVSNPLKGGEGLNLQIATLHYFYSNSFKADSRLQAEDRSHRIGQTNKVLYKDLLCKNTVDERIYQVLKNKENLINYFREKPKEVFMRDLEI